MAEPRAAAIKPPIEVDFLAPAQQAGELGRLGAYRVLKVLGHGGMGMVFLADDPQLKRSIALKVMLPRVAQNRTARERFLREAQAAARIEHDHIIPIYQVSEDRGVPFIAMPFLRGTNLEDYLKKKTLTVPQILRIGREIAKGLAAAHDKGLVHRDIKPANLWLDANAKGRVKILDFGLARLTQDDVQLTQDNAVLGTPSYMSPEQAAGKQVGAASDLFSLGAVLYRLCCGKRPFQGANMLALLEAIRTQTPPPIREVNPDVMPPFADLVMRLLEKDPEQRPRSATEVAETIAGLERQRLLERLGQPNPSLHSAGVSQVPSVAAEESAESDLHELEFSPDPTALFQGAARRSAWVVGVIAAGAAAVIGIVLAVVFLRGSSAPPPQHIPGPPARATATGADATEQAKLPPPPPPPPSEWLALFNGADFSNWKYLANETAPRPLPEVFARAEHDGKPAIHVTGKGAGWLTQSCPPDFHLRAQVKVLRGALALGVRGQNIRLVLDAEPAKSGWLLWDGNGTRITRGMVQDGRIVPDPDGTPIDFIDAASVAGRSAGAWNDVEIFWRDGASIYLLNGQVVSVVAAASAQRGGKLHAVAPEGIAVRAPGEGEGFVGDISVRPLAALPGDILERAAWQPLFNGRNLSTFKYTGAGMQLSDKPPVSPLRECFAVGAEAGEPVLHVLGLKGGCLVTPRPWDNFHLRAQVKVIRGKVHLGYHFNPGFRHNVELNEDPAESGKIRGADPKKMKLIGAELVPEWGLLRDGNIIRDPEPKPRNHLAMEAGRSAGQWNDVELVSLNGASIALLNGRITAVLSGSLVTREGKTDRIISGHLALRSFADGEAKVRRLEVRPISALPPAVVSAWRPLLYAAGTPPPGWTITDNPAKNVRFAAVPDHGQLSLYAAGDGTLTAKETLKDYHLRLEFRWPLDAVRHFSVQYYGRDKTGFGLIHNLTGEAKWTGIGTGTMLADEYELRGGKFVAKEGRRALGKQPLDLPLRAQRKVGDWNTLELICLGGTAVHLLNGECLWAASNHRQLLPDGREEPITSGSMGLNVYGPVQFRRIEVRQLRDIPPEILKKGNG